MRQDPRSDPCAQALVGVLESVLGFSGGYHRSPDPFWAPSDDDYLFVLDCAQQYGRKEAVAMILRSLPLLWRTPAEGGRWVALRRSTSGSNPQPDESPLSPLRGRWQAGAHPDDPHLWLSGGLEILAHTVRTLDWGSVPQPEGAAAAHKQLPSRPPTPAAAQDGTPGAAPSKEQREPVLGVRFRNDREEAAAWAIQEVLNRAGRRLAGDPIAVVEMFVRLADERGGLYAIASWAGWVAQETAPVTDATTAFVHHEEQAEPGRRWLATSALHPIVLKRVASLWPEGRPAESKRAPAVATPGAAAADPGRKPEPAAVSDAQPQSLDPKALQPGEILRRRLEVVQSLGKGGMAVVYLVKDLTLKKERALKVLNFSHGRERFLREARGTLDVQHKNVVRAFALHDDLFPDYPDVLALELEFVSGGSLEKKRPADWPLSVRLELLAGIADGVSAIHAAGLVHRDLKPANVLLDEAGLPKVSDLGLARSPTRGGETENMRTQAYAAPEQLLGGDLDARTDLYALGVMAYEFLAGEAPDRHAYVPVPPLNKPELAEDIVRLVGQCLEKEPVDRPSSASELARRLRAGIRREARHAAVIGLDIVGYSRAETGNQAHMVGSLNEAILSCPAVQAVALGRLLKLPAGDGAFLVFFEDAGAAWQTVTELMPRLAGDMRVRVGLHWGSVQPVADLNDKDNASGGGVNMCQRVMAFGDAFNVLASDEFREQLLAVRADAATSFHGPLRGIAKHGVSLTVWNVVGEGLGNETTSAKLRPLHHGMNVILRLRGSRWAIAAGALVGLCLGALVLHFAW